MMRLQERKNLLVKVGAYMQSGDAAWQEAKEKAFSRNTWFIQPFTERAVLNIAQQFLQPDALQQLIDRYRIPDKTEPRRIGIVMAGNIPLVGFHDLLCCFLLGHYAVFKPSSRDDALVTHLTAVMTQWEPGAKPYFVSGEYLRGCDAYIATGSDNTARHFEYYFKGRPSLIRRNRTSVAILTGEETTAELELLADDVFLYFGLGCRNVTLLYVPKDYNFVPLLEVFKKYDYLMDVSKYKNNYDYNLAVELLNHKYYMTNGSVLLTESDQPFSPISQLHYSYYSNKDEVEEKVRNHPAVQCVVGRDHVPFGQAQCPGITDFADGVDTMAFLLNATIPAGVNEVRRS